MPKGKRSVLNDELIQMLQFMLYETQLSHFYYVFMYLYCGLKEQLRNEDSMHYILLLFTAGLLHY